MTETLLYISSHALARVLRLAVREAGDPRTALASLRVLSIDRESLSNRVLAMSVAAGDARLCARSLPKLLRASRARSAYVA